MTVSSSAARFLGLLVVLGLSVGTTGCSSTSSPVRVQYTPSSDRTTYKTNRIQLEDIQFSSGYNRSPQFFLTVEGSCTGRDCTPQTYALRFSVEYSEPVSLTAESVSLAFGEQTRRWQNPFSVQRNSRVQALGTIFRVSLPSDELDAVGEAEQVTGTLGTLEFDLPYSSRAPIRALFASPDEDGAS
jgi:hypothetical protein